MGVNISSIENAHFFLPKEKFLRNLKEMNTNFLKKIDLPFWEVRDLKPIFKKLTWEIEYDNDEPLLKCKNCGKRIIAKPYIQAVAYNGYKYCPYCGKNQSEEIPGQLNFNSILLN